MAKKASETSESIPAYWERILNENPDWLRKSKNTEALQRYLDDHPGQTTVPQSVKTGLSSVKSRLARDKGIKIKGRRGRRHGSRNAAATNGKKVAPKAAPARVSSRRLESIEEAIDQVLHLVFAEDREGLDSVVSHLKRARRAVILAMGAEGN